MGDDGAMTPTTSTMSAIDFETPAGEEKPSFQHPADVVVSQHPLPSPGPGEVLIKVAAAGLNNLDLLQRAGNYPVPEGASEVPGVEVSGTIEAVGAGVVSWDFGAPVCALLAGGGYAEYVTVDARQVLPVPDGIPLVEAAGLPEVAATCWTNLVMQAGAEPGDWVLVHGGTGGIGSFALQMLAAFGAKPIATVGSEEKRQQAMSLGAVEAINYRDEDFAERVHEITEGHGADVILDVVGGKYLEDNVRALAHGGCVITIGLSGGAKGTLPLQQLMAKRGWITGSTLRSRSVEEKAEVIAQVREHVWPMIASGAISPSIAKTFPMAEAERALEYFASEGRTGKILLVVED